MHLEDGLIYLGVVVEVDEEQGQCLVRFGDGTERWSSFNELQCLSDISDDGSTTAPPELIVGTTEDKKYICSYFLACYKSSTIIIFDRLPALAFLLVGIMRLFIGILTACQKFKFT